MGLSEASRSRIKLITLSDNTSIAAAGTNVQTLQPAAGFIYKVASFAYTAPTIAAATGTQKLEVKLSTLSFFSMQSTSSATAQEISYRPYVGLSGAGASHYPASHILQLETIKTFICSYDDPITFTYTNNSDVAQAGNRILLILVEEIPSVI